MASQLILGCERIADFESITARLPVLYPNVVLSEF